MLASFPPFLFSQSACVCISTVDATLSPYSFQWWQSRDSCYRSPAKDLQCIDLRPFHRVQYFHRLSCRNICKAGIHDWNSGMISSSDVLSVLFQSCNICHDRKQVLHRDYPCFHMKMGSGTFLVSSATYGARWNYGIFSNHWDCNTWLLYLSPLSRKTKYICITTWKRKLGWAKSNLIMGP